LLERIRVLLVVVVVVDDSLGVVPLVVAVLSVREYRVLLLDRLVRRRRRLAGRGGDGSFEGDGDGGEVRSCEEVGRGRNEVV
jgi:hypothetical protein